MRTNSLTRPAPGAAALLALAMGAALASGGAPVQQAQLRAPDAGPTDAYGASVAVQGDTAVVGAPGVATVDDGAAYVFTRTGTRWTRRAKLTASDGSGDDRFGCSVALSGDTVVVGARQEGWYQGAAYVFTRTGTKWTEQAKLKVADPATYDFLGGAVAISGDTVLVGSFRRSEVDVFTRSGTAWTQQAKLVAEDGYTSDGFGAAVALQGDTALVGASNVEGSRGAAYVFTRTGTTWTREATLTAPDGAELDFFGATLALDGDTALVGARFRDAARGAVYAFRRSGADWALEATLTAGNGAADDFFGAVAIAGDTALVGAGGRNARRGAAYVFRRDGAVWAQSAEFTSAAAVADDGFGGVVALSGDTALIGTEGSALTMGEAYVFTGVAGAAPPADVPSPAYCLPTRVRTRTDAAHPERSSFTASGIVNTGADSPDLGGAATFDAGGFHLDVPAFVPKGRSLTYGAGGVELTLTPARSGSSHVAFSVKATGDLAGKVDPDGDLDLRFANALCDAPGSVRLTAGSLRPGGVAAPDVAVVAASATIKGAGRDTLRLTIHFAGDGAVPPAAEDLTLRFGDTFGATLAGGWTRKGSRHVRRARAPGITSATVDRAKRTITIVGSRLDLGAFAAGANPVVVTVTLGGETRSAAACMWRTGARLSY